MMRRNVRGGQPKRGRMGNSNAAFQKLMNKQNQALHSYTSQGAGSSYDDGYWGEQYYGPYEQDYSEQTMPASRQMRGRQAKSAGTTPPSLFAVATPPSLFAGPVQHGQVDGHHDVNDPDFIKKCKMYLKNIKKNIPGRDSLSVYCVACCVSSKNNQDFFSHLISSNHLEQMDKIELMPENTKKEVKKVIKEIQDQRSELKHLRYCDICEKDLAISYSDHKNNASHQRKFRIVHSGCGACKTGPLKNYHAFKEHCKTENHLTETGKWLEELNKKIEASSNEREFPPFKEGFQFGPAYVKPVDGYYCKLCRRFLPSEDLGQTHLTQHRHFHRVRDEYFDRKHPGPVDLGDYKLPGEEEDEATTSNVMETEKGQEEQEAVQEEDMTT